MCLVSFLAQEGRPIMWSSYYCAELGKGSLAAFLLLLLPLTIAETGPLFPTWCKLCIIWDLAFSVSPLPENFLQGPCFKVLSFLQTPRTLLSITYMLVIHGLTWAMMFFVLNLFFYVNFLFQFSECMQVSFSQSCIFCIFLVIFSDFAVWNGF